MKRTTPAPEIEVVFELNEPGNAALLDDAVAGLLLALAPPVKQTADPRRKPPVDIFGPVPTAPEPGK
jgi:hypothetical protein